ncbi:putative location of vulva defective 1-like, partial [Triplophysa rosa]
NPGSILSLLFGCAMLQLICCYSDGSLLEEECQGMNINHGKPPQNSESPFTVDPENETFNDSYVGRNISVVLSTTSSPFNGFMLEAYECEGCKPAGTFSLTDPSSTVLLKCDGHSDRAVSHSNNFNKYSITVKWHVPAAGTFHFRAAFTQTFSVFWLRKPIQATTVAPTTTTQATPSETNADTSITATPTTSTAFTTTYTTGTDAATTTNNTGSTAVTPLSPVPMDYVRCVLALLLFSRLCFLGGWSVQFITPVQRNVAKILFVLELASKIIAFILVLIRAKKYPSVWQCAGFRVEFTALTGIAMVLSLLHTITIFLFCGPSHELRKCWLCAAIVVHLLNTCITTATIFVGVWCFQGRWLPILMGAYVIWEILLHLISLRCDQIEKKQIRRHTGAGIQNQGMRRRVSE